MQALVGMSISSTHKKGHRVGDWQSGIHYMCLSLKDEGRSLVMSVECTVLTISMYMYVLSLSQL